MDTVLDVEPAPDGHGWWPKRFGVDQSWCDDLGPTWRTVTNYTTMQARRRGDLLDLRQTDQTHTYRIALAEHGYLATKEN